MIREQLRPTFISFLLLTALTGVLYPLSVTGIAQVFFKHQANGSLILLDHKAVGSALIGQPFDDPKYLWGRLSATSPFSYNAASSSGSNYGPMNPDFLKAVQGRIKSLKASDPGNSAPVPVDLVTASASGLDPHITPAAAYYQVPRIARARGLSETAVKNVIQQHTQNRLFGIIGEPVVNVLEVNLSLNQERK